MWNFNIDVAVLLAFVATVQSLVFDYFPGVAAWFDKLAVNQKKLLVLGVSALFAVLAFVGTCEGYFNTGLACTQYSIVTLLGNLALSVSVGYAVHEQTKPDKKLKKILGI